MARYEFRCRTCDERFEVRRPMSEADAPAECPSGHADVVRLLSVFASVGSASGAGARASEAASLPSGGGCGAACACQG